jgi:uncharacterized membrane protein
MARLINIWLQTALWWRGAKFLLAVIIVAFLIAQGLHPVWGILLFIFRKAAFRICIFLGLLYWLTHGIL